MRTLAILLIALLVAPTAAFAGKHLKELKQQCHHNHKMKQGAHQACKEQSGHHQILHHKK